MKNNNEKQFSQNLINLFWHLPRAILANIYFGFPTRKMTVVGVTGTDGKTTTTNLIYKILKDAGKSVSMISTINAVIGKKKYDTGFHVTSPDAFLVQKLAKEAENNGSNYLILEVTSHALDQFRFWGINFMVGVITNITHEHLDYHRSFNNYVEAKLKLLKGVKFAILNWSLSKMYKISAKTITFGLNKGDFNQKKLSLKLKIIGDYNIENALAAIAATSVLGIDLPKIKKSVENFVGLKGRMEEVKNKLGIKIVVDFAHTPNGLKQALTILRSQASRGRLIAVFGCAGERDIEKRPMMGKISARLADITILTDEDPRSEDRNMIIEEIAKGALSGGAKEGVNLFKQPNRQNAIKLATSLAKKNDVIGIFGKGHERSINYQGIETPWSDVKAVEKVLNEQ